MTEPRKSTVYDYSDLRLHPDGTRVYQRSTNLRPKFAQCTVEDARSNWIATDAGGSVRVPLFKRKKKVTLEGEWVGEMSENISACGSAGSQEVDDNIERGKRKSRPQDHRKVKRQRFTKNDDYLAEDAIPDASELSATSLLSLPSPSPDLLKCIHRFASEYYSERGQLLNSSRQYRKERKERRIKRASSPSSHSISSGESRSKEEVGDDSDVAASEADDEVTKLETKRRKRRKGRHRSEKLHVDMYKVFDGSAMMAMGMLMQEHITHLLKQSVPESWEREIQSAYTNPWGDSAQLEDSGEFDEEEQISPEDGKVSQENARGGIREKSGSLNQGSLKCRSTLQQDDNTSEEENLTNDESSRSEDTEHPSSSEGEYR